MLPHYQLISVVNTQSGCQYQSAYPQGVRYMPNARRARAIAIAKADDSAILFRFRLAMIAVGATAALMALPFIF
jgi:hypothetical protein